MTQIIDIRGEKKVVISKNRRAQDGLNAYQVAIANGFVGTEAEWLESLVGEQGEQGPPGAGASGFYTHTQAIAAGIWNIQHNLGFFPNVTVVDSANTKVIGDIEYVDLNNLILSFSGGFSGKAFLS